MKKAASVLLIFAVFFVFGCSKKDDGASVSSEVSPSEAVKSAVSGVPAEVQKVMDRTIAIMDESAEKLEKAVTDKDAAAALEYYGTNMKELVAKAKELQKKYPTVAFLPDEAGRVAEGAGEAVQKASERFVKAVMATMQKFPTSPAIMKAYEHIGSIGGE